MIGKKDDVIIETAIDVFPEQWYIFEYTIAPIVSHKMFLNAEKKADSL